MRQVRPEGAARDLMGLGTALAPGNGSASASPGRTASEALPRVLVVDDNPVAQRLLAGLLSKRGFEVVAARNGRAALDTLEEVDCDAVLMDVEMPEMDGFEATRRIRASRHSALPIIAITSLSLDGDRRRCLEAGMDDYVGKPFQPAILIETLLRYLGQPAGSVPRCA